MHELIRIECLLFGSIVISQWFSGWDVPQNHQWGFLEIKMSSSHPRLTEELSRGLGKGLGIFKKLQRWYDIHP